MPRRKKSAEGVGVKAEMSDAFDESALLALDPKKLTGVIKTPASRRRGRTLRPAEEPAFQDYSAAEATIEIARILRLVSTEDRALMVDTELGFTDREIAERRRSTPGAVRVRLSRLRLKLVA